MPTKTASGVPDYGYRYYCPALGRWLSRDPLGERAESNSSVFIGNNPVVNIDLYGLVRITQIQVTYYGTLRYILEEGFSGSIGFAKPETDLSPVESMIPCGIQGVQYELRRREFEVSFRIGIRKAEEAHRDRLHMTPLEHEMKHVEIWVGGYAASERVYAWPESLGCVCLDCYRAIVAVRDAMDMRIIAQTWIMQGELEEQAYGGGAKILANGRALLSDAERDLKLANSRMREACGWSLTSPLR